MRLRKNLVAAGAAVGMTLAGLGVAAAQTDGATTTPPSDSTTAPAERLAGPGGRHGGPGKGGPGGKGMGIHGEFVAPAPSGGYQTIATQKGTVTDVSATSLKVKSEDGFERTYVVNDDTMVGAGNNGIADVAVGDDVHVTAVVTGDTATAKSVHERPAKPAPAQPAS